MEESILKTIKDMLGICDEDTAFDNDVLVNINAVFSTLYQVGVGDETHYYIIDEKSTWKGTFVDEEDLIDFIKLYTYMKVRLIFDPPTNSSIMEALKAQINEIEYRILLQADPHRYFEDNEEYPDDEDGEKPSPSIGGTLTNKDIKDLWNEIIGTVPELCDHGPMSDDEIVKLWNEIIEKR